MRVFSQQWLQFGKLILRVVVYVYDLCAMIYDLRVMIV